jgi:hypothetical protein
MGVGKQLQAAKTAVWRDSRTLMGTLINLVLVGDDDSRIRTVADATFTEMTRLVTLFDHRQPDSPLAQTQPGRGADQCPAELVAVISLALHYGDLSNGAFDISVKPLLDQARQSQNGTFRHDLWSITGRLWSLAVPFPWHSRAWPLRWTVSPKGGWWMARWPCCVRLALPTSWWMRVAIWWGTAVVPTAHPGKLLWPIPEYRKRPCRIYQLRLRRCHFRRL